MREQLARLVVKGRGPKTGYSREEFGDEWRDPDGNHCDARNDVLRRDLTSPTIAADGCTALAGDLQDPYTGTLIEFRRGQGTSSAVQVDHVVALSNAWQTGASAWTSAQREQFANDPLELLAVDGPANEQKGDGDAATWLPANKGYRCAYVTRQVQIKAVYELWVTPAERDAMTRVLSSC